MRVIKRLKYINQYRDNRGRLRYYFRRRGQARIPLRGEPGSDEFMMAYKAALASLCIGELGKDKRSIPGSVSAAIAGYYCHNSFTTLGEGTRKMRRAILERFRKPHGDKPLGLMRQKDIVAILGKLKPFAQHNWLKTLRGLMKFAVEIGLRSDDPTSGIERVRAKAGRIHTWDEAEIAQYEATHPVGGRARLAMALMLYSGQRKSDIVRLGPQHIRGGKLFVRQKKPDMERRDEVLEIPVHPELAGIIAASEIGNLAFLVTAHGKPFTAAGFGNLFRGWCDEAGLPQCSSHGLRKAICRRLAEAGCTAPQIASISGHKSLAEVQRYIEAANRAKMAEQALDKIAQPKHAANTGDAKVTSISRKSD
jgi:integrase